MNSTWFATSRRTNSTLRSSPSHRRHHDAKNTTTVGRPAGAGTSIFSSPFRRLRARTTGARSPRSARPDVSPTPTANTPATTAAATIFRRAPDTPDTVVSMTSPRSGRPLRLDNRGEARARALRR